MKQKIMVILCMALAITVMACAEKDVSKETTTEMSIPSPTVTSTPSPIATSTPSPTVTSTPSPTATSIPTPSQQEIVSNDFECKMEDDTVIIMRIKDTNASELVIPEEIQGYTVVAIGEGAFVGCTSLTNVTIPDSVTRIGEGAFAGCMMLRVIYIPSAVTTIGDSVIQQQDKM